MEQHFFTHDPDIERALKFQQNLKFGVVGYHTPMSYDLVPAQSTNACTLDSKVTSSNHPASSGSQSHQGSSSPPSQTATEKQLYSMVRGYTVTASSTRRKQQRKGIKALRERLEYRSFVPVV
ncbi:hypothetical protein TNCV_3391261 [Trichonephila clavipes]|nr:hypothetical protein TNCV_3391261 [Trichonephila clavipes]